MKAKKIESELKKLDIELKEIAREMGAIDFSKETDLNSKDVLAWVNGHRNFSYEKLIRIAIEIKERVISYRKTHKDQT